MSTTLEWTEVALRLGLTGLAGALLGVNRSERGVAAGLRTTLLVSLAAAVAMLQANLLMATAGRAPDSFVSLDLMRLPLGILTGMGFIGAGAVLRRGDRILGVTTAATLWLATVIGLCLGGGQITLGLVALAAGIATLSGLKYLESRLPQDRHATLTLVLGAGGPADEEVAAALKGAGYSAASWDVAHAAGDAPRRRVRCVVVWRGKPAEVGVPEVVARLRERPGVLKLRWQE